MKEIRLLAAVDRNWGIGCQNQLLFRLKKDMDFFRKKTTHNIVIMGRKTLESLPGGKPLPNRTNIVLTGDREMKKRYGEEGGELVFLHSPEEVLAYVEHDEREVFVIGGEQTYREFLDVASEAYITKVDTVRTADTFFPDLDQEKEWEKKAEGERITDESGVTFRFTEYCRTDWNESPLC